MFLWFDSQKLCRLKSRHFVFIRCAGNAGLRQNCPRQNGPKENHGNYMSRPPRCVLQHEKKRQAQLSCRIRFLETWTVNPTMGGGVISGIGGNLACKPGLFASRVGRGRANSRWGSQTGKRLCNVKRVCPTGQATEAPP